MSRTTEVHASADAWVQEDAPGKRHPRGPRLRISGISGERRRAFIHFRKPFPVGGSCISATLQLHVRDGWAGSHVLSVDRVQDQWGERHVRWNTQPPVVGATVTKNLTDLNDKDLVEVDVTPIYNAVAVGGAYAGLRLSMSDSVKRAFYASEHPVHSLRPLLVVQWAEKPEPPRDGAPAGGMAVAFNQPNLDYKFGPKGSDPGQRQDAVNVQISASTDFTTPVFDSGWQTQDVTMYDLAGSPGYTVPPGVDRWWRARARDADGLISDWSDKWQFKYVALPTLTLVNPAASPSNVVHDLTPPVSWTFPGQVQFELMLHRQRANGTWKKIWHLPRHKSTDTSVNVPAGKIRSGPTYRVTVRAWDGVDRQSISGASKYAEATRQFTYTRDGSPSPVTNLTGTVDGPGILISWTDSAQPDYYCITVNGEEVLPRIEPEDVFVAGDTYGYRYQRGDNGVLQSIEVERVINSAGNLLHSGPNPKVNRTPKVLGKWLVDDDPADPLMVQIIGREQSNFNIGESAESLNPLHSRVTVTIADSVRGFEGTVTGTLDSNTDADNFLALVGRLKGLRYIAQHVNVPVEIIDPSLSPLADALDFDGWSCGFTIHQQGEFFDVAGLDDSSEDD